MKKPLAIVLLLIGGAAVKMALSAASINKDTEKLQKKYGKDLEGKK